MMEGNGIERLRYEQEKAVSETRERINQLENFKKDYLTVKERIVTLPDKVTHNVMVPFGKFAFMPGKLIHTNEITVLLGDNWFAERSAKQAAEIVERRAEGLDKQIHEFTKQMDLLKPRLDFTSAMKNNMTGDDDVREIKENYDENQEKEWRKRHRMSVKRAKQKEKINRSASTATTSDDTYDDKMWERLAQLEQQERRQSEYRILDNELSDSKQAEKLFLESLSKSELGHELNIEDKKQVRWRDKEEEESQKDTETESELEEEDDESCTDSDDQYDDEYREADVPLRTTPLPKTIRFSHSNTGSTEAEASEKLPTDRGRDIIISPADIYTQFIDNRAPRSILKLERTTPFPRNPSPEPQVPEKVILPGSIEAFSGEVKETDNASSIVTIPTATDQEMNVISPSPAAVLSPPQTDQPAKRVSRFKAQRMQQNS